jgi:hypothetical protein
MKPRYLIASGAFIAFLFIISALFVPQIGFGEDQARSTTIDYVVESPHPYYNNMDEWYVIEVPGAQWLSLFFDQIYLKRSDFLYIYNEAGVLIHSLTRCNYYDVWTAQLDGDTAYLNLVTDSRLTKYGFKVSRVEYEDGGTPPPVDTEPPVVTITTPADGATVADIVSINVQASDNEDPDVDLELKIGSGDWFSTTGTYNWDTTSVANGDVTIEARGTDDASNVGYDQIVVTVDNSVEPPPVQDGDEHFLGAVAGLEVDYYEIYAYAGGAPIAVSVSWVGSVDIDCYIMNTPDYTDYLARGYTTNNPETCSYQPTADGTYYIGVRMYTSSAPSTDYDCHVTWQAEEPPPPPPPSGDKWAILVGISDYKAISDLSYCDEDATDWYNYLVNTMGYATTNIRVLGDGHTSNYPAYYATATEYQYRACLDWVATNADGDDTVVFATSGHGSGDGRGSSFLCAWDCNSGESGYDGSFYDTEVDNYVQNIAAIGAKVLFFIDHCYSGGFGPEMLAISDAANVLTLTTCTEDGYGWDDGTHQNGMWTYWFLEAGLIGQFGSSTTTTMEDAFQWAHDNYPKSGGDEPQKFDGAPSTAFLL